MNDIIKSLNDNKEVFSALLSGIEREQYSWRQSSEKWCLLEIICHLYDEERLDFRFRTKWVLEQPNEVPPAFDQLSWVKEHDYMSQNYSAKLNEFLSERSASIEWLNRLKDPQWEHSFVHPKLGTMTAGYFLKNWLAHDYLHMRQILKLKFDYLRNSIEEGLDYAGTW